MPEEERDHSFLVPTGRVQINTHLGRRDGWLRGEKVSHARSPQFLPAIACRAVAWRRWVDLAMDQTITSSALPSICPKLNFITSASRSHKGRSAFSFILARTASTRRQIALS